MGTMMPASNANQFSAERWARRARRRSTPCPLVPSSSDSRTTPPPSRTGPRLSAEGRRPERRTLWRVGTVPAALRVADVQVHRDGTEVVARDQQHGESVVPLPFPPETEPVGSLSAG